MSNNCYFELKKDRYCCIRLEPKHYSSLKTDELSSKLAASITRWQHRGVRGLWAIIDLAHCNVISIFAENGFDYHHAQPGYVMMKRWISNTEPDNLPPYANQYLGAAGFVVNNKNEVLVVQERFCSESRWKLPGGLAETGENLGDAAEREVYEETGVRAKFQCIVSFRHMHKYRFGCSDFYFICLMKPITQEINKCQYEIAEATWLDINEYINHPKTSVANQYFAQCYMDMIAQGNQRIQPNCVLSYTMGGYDLIYSIQTYQSNIQHDVAEQDKGDNQKQDVQHGVQECIPQQHHTQEHQYIHEQEGTNTQCELPVQPVKGSDMPVPDLHDVLSTYL